MRFISQQKIKIDIPETWKNKARKVMLHLELLDESVNEYIRLNRILGNERNQLLLDLIKERKAIINNNANLWAELKDILAKQNFNKCWYCETIENRSDKAVDHFRPKCHVAEDVNHGGYWWLAFSWENYRFSCTLCNSRRRFDDTTGGKQDNFPLFEPPKRASRPGEESREIVVLLDPCDYEDVDKLTYNANGDTISVSTASASIEYKRAQKSIELYHLNHTYTCRARKKLNQDIEFLVSTVNTLLKKKAKAEAKENQEKIINLIRHDSEEAFSTSAKMYLRQYTHFDWVKYILEKF